MNRILVTGATGSAGRHLVRLLHDRGAPVRALVRDRDRALALLGPGVELAGGDYSDAGSVRAAMHGVDRLFLTCANHPLQVNWENTCIDAAADAGLDLVVKQSALGAELASPAPFLVANARIEEHLRGSGLPHRLLRPSFKMSNLLAGAEVVRRTGRLFLPGGGARIAMIDPQDIAEVAAVLLLQEEAIRQNDSLWLTGPAAVTFDNVAECLSKVTGQVVEYVPVPDSTAREQLVDAGTDPWFVDGMIAQFRLLRQGAQAEVSDAVRCALGRDPRSILDFLPEVGGAFGALAA
jgi:uncharacterized protein YbjT (DUF2867 family)